MHDFLLKIHVGANIVFTLSAILLLFYSVRGLLSGLEYRSFNVYIENTYIAFLYFGLILGIVLYFFADGSNELTNKSIEELKIYYNTRLWAIEHFCVMIFALLIAQIGRIFTKKAISSREQFQFSLFYYGSSTLVIILSVIAYFYYRVGS